MLGASLFRSSCRHNLTGRRRYISRAHGKPTPTFPVQSAIDQILEGIKERKEQRAAKWERNKQALVAKGKITEADSKTEFRNQDETIELCMNLNLDPRKPGQALRGTLSLPNGTGRRKVRVAVFTSDDEIAKRALEAGAAFAGGESLVDKIVAGEVVPETSFGRSLASQDMMGYLSQKLARVLGPRGLMPNIKVGTLVKSADKLLAVLQTELAGQQIEYRTDKAGVVHLICGKGSFEPSALLENTRAILEEVQAVKPESYGKGKKSSSGAQYILSAFLTSTQHKGSVKLDLRAIDPTSPFFLSTDLE